MPSFDVVSKADVAEIDNALNGVGREIKQRYDLKGTMCSIERTGSNLTVVADNDMLLRQMHQLLQSYCARRGVDIGSLDFKDPQNAAKGSLRQEIAIRQGIEDSMARSIVKMIKASKLKVQIAIQGEELRITGKKRDDLQQAINAIKEMELDLPLQYINFRE
jgi:uncharacterized protein YajQ (UPF0234 family)